MAVESLPPGRARTGAAATAEAAAEFAALFAAAVDALVVIDAAGSMLEFNPAAELLFGYGQDEVLGQDVSMLMPEPHRSRHADYIVRFLTSREAKIIGIGRQVEGQRKDGSVFPMELAVGEVVDGVSARFVGIVRDLTRQKAAEEETRRLQNRLAHVGRFSTMGEMAAGLAHEINQPLSAITTYAETGKRLLAADAESAELGAVCEKIAKQARRAGQVIENLRNFIRDQEVQKDDLDLNAVVADIVSLINADARAEGILVDVDYAAEPLPVCGDAIQLQQVLVNLTRNAVDAMKQGLYKERGIQVRTKRVDGYTAAVTVTDHGHGVPAQLAESIFHPFVSTKSDGLGIGLAISRTIAQGHGGDLTYRPNPEGGCIFGFSLPISVEEWVSTDDAVVYIVDDDEAVRDSLSLLLKSVGYQAQTYGSAMDFLEDYAAAQHGCLVADIRMPGMSGLDLQAALIKDDSELPIIFITGHGDVPMAVDAMKAGALDFIQKPFRDQDLLDRINQALVADSERRESGHERTVVRARLAALTPREREVMERVVKGQANKVIALDLGVSQRTVEIHRARVMQKMHARSLAELVTLAGKIHP